MRKEVEDLNTDWVMIHATIPIPKEILHPKRKSVWKDVFFLIKRENLLDFLHENKGDKHYTLFFDLDDEGTVTTASSYDRTDKTTYLFENQVEKLRKEIG
ncbi:MAG: hypothetical protein QXR53_02720 [Candidatus Norongarragalinales archaeon]